jgi:hypothetical protein
MFADKRIYFEKMKGSGNMNRILLFRNKIVLFK